MTMTDAIKNVVRWNVPTFHPDDSVDKVINAMTENHIATIIVEKNGEVCGVVSDTDLIDSVIEHGCLKNLLVNDVMSPCELAVGGGTRKPCAQVDEDESIENTLKVFASSGTHCLIVGSGDGRTAGLIALRELLKVAMDCHE